MSDSLGLLGALCFILLAWRYHRNQGPASAALAALVLGLTLGVRLSYFPLAITLLVLILSRFRSRDLLAALAGGLLGVLPWLPWQIVQEGPERFLLLALQFTGGHLGDWGGAAQDKIAMGKRSSEYTIGNITALRMLVGEPKTETFLRGLMKNKPTYLRSDSMVRQAVGAGEFALGWVNHSYYFWEKADGSPVDVVWPDQGSKLDLTIYGQEWSQTINLIEKIGLP